MPKSKNERESFYYTIENITMAKLLSFQNISWFISSSIFHSLYISISSHFIWCLQAYLHLITFSSHDLKHSWRYS